MKSKRKIINPVTGRLVKRDGQIGKNLVKTKSVITSRKRYNHLIKLWNWWGQRSETERLFVADKWWDSKLNDIVPLQYPFYLVDYEDVLRKAYKTLTTK